MASAGDITIKAIEYAADSVAVAQRKHYFYANPMAVTPAWYEYPRWKDGREYKTEEFTSNGLTMLRQSTHTWQQAAPVSWWVFDPADAPQNGPRICQTNTTLGTQTAGQIFFYDQYNNRSDLYEYEYGAAPPISGACSGVPTPGSGYTRRIQTLYLTSGYDTATGIHLRSLPIQESVYDGNNTEKARIAYEYDNYVSELVHQPLSARPGISGLEPAFSTNYTTRGNVTAISRWLSTTNTFINTYRQYDIAGNVVKAIDARGYATNFGYSDVFGAPNGEARTSTQPAELGAQASFAFPTQVTNPLGHASYIQYDYYLGRPVDTEDLNGVVTTASYSDPLDRPTQVISANNTGIRSQARASYDDTSRTITTASDLKTYGDNQRKSEAVYDGLGRKVETRQYEGATGYIATEQKYGAMGRIWKVSNPYRPGLEPLYWTETEYDALGRVTRVTKPDGSMVDTLHRGNETIVVDEAGKQRKNTHDTLGRLVQVVEDPAVPGETHLDYQTTYAYDALNNLKTVEQGGQTRTFIYDSLSRLTSATNPENGMVEYPSYDGNGNLLQKRDARGTITYSYDQLNRITSRTYMGGTPMTPTVTFEYDNANVPNSRGRLTKVTSTSDTETLTYGYDEYDAPGRVKRSSQVTEGNQYLMSYGYDLAGNMTSQTYPSGRVVTTEYDLAGRVTGLRNQAGGYYAGAAPTDANKIHYASHGAVDLMRLGNGLWEQTDFNNRLQPWQVRLGASSGSASVLGLVYSYGGTNNNGNVLSQTITAPGFSKSQSYSYDPLNRLETVGEDNGVSWSQTYQYDRYGNRWVASGSYMPNPAQLAFDPATNRLAPSPSEAIQYDSAGSLIVDAAGNTFTYDLENRQTSYNGTTATYSYDGEGRRVKKVEPSGTTIYVYNVLGQLVAEYGDQVPASIGATSYFTMDHLGSTRVLTDGGGGVKKRYDCLPFGEEIPCDKGGRCDVLGYSSTDNTRQRFTGKERDAESGLDYFGARYFSSSMGRFSSPDAKGIAFRHLLNPQKLNKYSYVLNNPLSFFDPNGMEEITITYRTFIPARSFKYMGTIYSGDGRRFSTAAKASSRSSMNK